MTEPDQDGPEPDSVEVPDDDDSRTGEEQAAINQENDPPA